VFAAEDLAGGRLAAPFPERVLSGAGFHALYRETAPHERGTRELLRWLDLEAEAAIEALDATGSPPPANDQRPENALHAH
jgi:hypothetical protein